ncbi:hypothetical protein GFV14_00366 [Candidatus Hartigia pinicola]|nr:hypothetical protein GFV14_00366 [Candidatus Hartigia pinicola]
MIHENNLSKKILFYFFNKYMNIYMMFAWSTFSAINKLLPLQTLSDRLSEI